MLILVVRLYDFEEVTMANITQSVWCVTVTKGIPVWWNAKQKGDREADNSGKRKGEGGVGESQG
jgi:hypothetical protein